MFLLGGSWAGGNGGKLAEVWDPEEPDEWRVLEDIDTDAIVTDDPKGVYRADNHGWFFGWSKGEGARLAAFFLFVCLMPLE